MDIYDQNHHYFHFISIFSMLNIWQTRTHILSIIVFFKWTHFCPLLLLDSFLFYSYGESILSIYIFKLFTPSRSYLFFQKHSKLHHILQQDHYEVHNNWLLFGYFCKIREISILTIFWNSGCNFLHSFTVQNIVKIDISLILQK